MEANKKKTGRLFFAVVPGPEPQQALYKFARLIRLDGSEKVTSPDMLHITLRYIGPVMPSVQECLLEKASRISSASFSIELDQVDYWKKPRVTWCGPSTIPPLLLQLVNQIEDVCDSCGIKPEQREYKPHVTLLRKSLARYLNNLPEKIHLEVNSFVLFESVSTAHGVEYHIVKKWLLQD